MISNVNPIDENHLLYGNYIGLQYAFKSALDVNILKAAIDESIAQFPALSGRYQAKSQTIKHKENDVALELNQSDLFLKDILHSAKRPQYIREPKRQDVLRGRAPLSTFTLTRFTDGGEILGVAISHLLSDAAGYHQILQHLGDIYTALLSGQTAPEFRFVTQLGVFKFGSQRSKSETLLTLKRRALPKPMPINGILGGFIKTMIIKAMDKSLRDNPPISISLSPEDIAKLKQTVLTESGEDWISTNVALCAHFTSIMAKLSYGDVLKTQIQVGQLLDLRGRYFEADSKFQSEFIGNAILIHIDNVKFADGLQNTSRGALAKYFIKRQNKTDTKDVKNRLDLLADSLRYGYTNPELDVKNPIISLNNQSKMKVYNVQFGAQFPQRIYPQDVGDNIMFFPAANGGIDVYIRDIVNPRRQRELLKREWQARIFDI